MKIRNLIKAFILSFSMLIFSNTYGQDCYTVSYGENDVVLSGNQVLDTLDIRDKTLYVDNGQISAKHTLVSYLTKIHVKGSFHTQSYSTQYPIPFVLVVTMADYNSSFTIGGIVKPIDYYENVYFGLKYCGHTLPLGKSVRLSGMDDEYVYIEATVLPNSKFQHNWAKISWTKKDGNDTTATLPITVPEKEGKHILKIKKEK